MAFKEPADKDLDENEGAAIGSGVRWGSIYLIVKKVFFCFFILLSYVPSQLQFLLSSQSFHPISPLLQVHSFISLQKGACLPGLSAKHSLSSIKLQ